MVFSSMGRLQGSWFLILIGAGAQFFKGHIFGKAAGHIGKEIKGDKGGGLLFLYFREDYYLVGFRFTKHPKYSIVCTNEKMTGHSGGKQMLTPFRFRIYCNDMDGVIREIPDSCYVL